MFNFFKVFCVWNSIPKFLISCTPDHPVSIWSFQVSEVKVTKVTVFEYSVGRGVPYLNKIFGGLDGERKHSYVWLLLCPWISYIDPISTYWHGHVLVYASSWIQWCVLFRICVWFWGNSDDMINPKTKNGILISCY